MTYRGSAPTSWLQAATTYLGMLPTPILVLFLLTLSAFAAHQGTAWVQGVDRHMERASGEGYVRLGKVETLASTTSQRVENVRGEVQDLRGELREMRRDQLSYYRWMAEQLGDHGKAREMDQRLKSIEGQP